MTPPGGRRDAEDRVEKLIAVRERLDRLPSASRRSVTIPLPEGASREATPLGFPDFGLYIFRNERLFLSVRCGGVGQGGRGGHAHNDALSIELNVDGRDLIADPGTYVYTSLPQRRNQYRSVRAHAAPRLRGEPGDLDRALFLLPDRMRAECLYFGPAGFAGVHHGYGVPVYRVVALREDSVEVLDAVEGAEWPDGPADAWMRSEVPFSPGYGVVMRPGASLDDGPAA